MRKSVRLPVSSNWLALGQEPVTAAKIGNFIFTSSVPGIDLATGKLAEGPEAQFKHAFQNMMTLLKEAGAGPDSIGLLTVFIPRREHRAYINTDWLALYPGSDRPARKTNQMPLPQGMEVQLMAACVLNEKRVAVEIPGLSHKDPLPIGTRMGPVVFSSVFSPEDPKDGKPVSSAQQQIDRCFENMKLFMQHAGGSHANINHTWVFMKDFAHQPAMVERFVNDYPEFGDRPARKTLPYDLPGEMQIQTQLTGYLGARRKNYEVPGIGHEDPIPMASSIGPLLQSSGMFGIDPSTGKRVDGLPAQVEKGVANVKSLLDRAGITEKNVAHLTIMLQDFSDADHISQGLARLFPDPDNAPAFKFVNYRMPAHWRVQFHVTAIMD